MKAFHPCDLSNAVGGDLTVTCCCVWRAKVMTESARLLSPALHNFSGAPEPKIGQARLNFQSHINLTNFW